MIDVGTCIEPQLLKHCVIYHYLLSVSGFPQENNVIMVFIVNAMMIDFYCVGLAKQLKVIHKALVLPLFHFVVNIMCKI